MRAYLLIALGGLAVGAAVATVCMQRYTHSPMRGALREADNLGAKGAIVARHTTTGEATEGNTELSKKLKEIKKITGEPKSVTTITAKTQTVETKSTKLETLGTNYRLECEVLSVTTKNNNVAIVGRSKLFIDGAEVVDLPFDAKQSLAMSSETPEQAPKLDIEVEALAALSRSGFSYGAKFTAPVTKLGPVSLGASLGGIVGANDVILAGVSVRW